MASVEDLPNEILERIFCFVDGTSLAISTGVCRKWREVIESQLRIDNLWRQCCLREIPKDMLSDLIGGFELRKSDEVDNIVGEGDDDDDANCVAIPVLEAFDLNIDWKYIYKMWYFSDKIRDRETIEAFTTFDSIPIVCCKVSGSYVLTAHRNGSVCAWEWQTGQLKTVVMQHLRIVTDIALVDLLKSGPYGDKSCHSYHHHLISVSKDHTIQIAPITGENNDEPKPENRLTILHSLHDLESVRVFGNRFAVRGLDKTASVWRLSVPTQHWEKVEVQKICSICGAPDLLPWISFWKNKVVGICPNTILQVYSLKDKANEPYLIADEIDCSDVNDYLMIKNAFLFWSKTIILITVDCHMWVSVDGTFYFRQEIRKTLRSSVQALALKAGIFVVGLEEGVIVGYKINEPMELVCLNLENPAFRIKLSEASIISLDIGDKNGVPIVAASTSESIFVISWQPFKLHHYRCIRHYDSDSDSSF